MATLQIFASQQFFIQSVHCQHVTRGAVCIETSFPSPDCPAIAAESHACAEWNARLEVVFSLWERDLPRVHMGCPGVYLLQVRTWSRPMLCLHRYSVIPSEDTRFVRRKRYQYSVTVLIGSHRKITVRNCLKVQLRQNIKGWLLPLV